MSSRLILPRIAAVSAAGVAQLFLGGHALAERIPDQVIQAWLFALRPVGLSFQKLLGEHVQVTRGTGGAA